MLHCNCVKGRKMIINSSFKRKSVWLNQLCKSCKIPSIFFSHFRFFNAEKKNKRDGKQNKRKENCKLFAKMQCVSGSMSIKKDELILFISIFERIYYASKRNQQISSMLISTHFSLCVCDCSHGRSLSWFPLFLSLSLIFFYFAIVVCSFYFFFQVFGFVYNFTKCYAFLICKINKIAKDRARELCHRRRM